MADEPFFKVGRDQFDLQFFRAGGKGGQKQNKTSSACRIVHRASGAVGESRDERSQAQNKKLAFRRCVESKEFQVWLRLEAAARLKGYADLEARIDEMMRPENLVIETYDPEKR